MDIFGGSQSLTPHERVDGAIVNKDLNKTIKGKGGGGDVYAVATKAITEELFDLNPEALYEATGGTPGKRNLCPRKHKKPLLLARFGLTMTCAGGRSKAVLSREMSKLSIRSGNLAKRLVVGYPGEMLSSLQKQTHQGVGVGGCLATRTAIEGGASCQGSHGFGFLVVRSNPYCDSRLRPPLWLESAC